MISVYEVNETNKMIEQENLDVRTITLGISLMDCIDSDLDRLNDNIYKKITTLAGNLVSTGQDIEREFGIPIVNSVSLVLRSLWWAQQPARLRMIMLRLPRHWIRPRKKLVSILLADILRWYQRL